MSWQTPATWKTVTLADVCYRIVDGSHNPPPGQSSGKPMLSAKNIQNGKIHFDELRLLSRDDFELENKRTNISAGDVLLTIVGALGRTAVVPETHPEFTLQRSVAVLKSEVINPNYLRYLLDSPVAQTFFLENAKGTAQKGIYLKALGGMQVPIAPLAEQTRIAQKLDELLAQVDTLKARIDAIPALLKRFRQSTLAAAVSGRLTADWRADQADLIEEGNPATAGGVDANAVLQAQKEQLTPITQTALVLALREQGDIPNGWQWKMLVNLAKLESGHTPRKSISSYWENGDVPWLSLQDIRAADGKEIHQTKHMPTMLGIENSSARLLPKGTVCFCRDISVGYVTIMGKSMSTTQHFANWICKEELIPKYLMFAFMASREHLTRSGQGSTVKTIYMPALKELRLSLPPLEEQTEIVRRVEQLFAFTDQLEAKIKTAQARINHLTQSILAKAFRGELVPQDPNDEPASELLARIHAQRAAEPKAKRGRKASA